MEGDASLEARAAHLRERVASGGLSPARLRLLAHLGHDAARAALPEPLSRPPDPVDAWLAGLERLEPRAALRAALEAARVVAEAWDRTRLGAAGREELEEVTRAVGDWLACPCAWHESEVSLLVCSGTVPPRRAWLAEPLLLAASAPDAPARDRAAWDLAAARLAELGTADAARELRALTAPRLVARLLADSLPPADPEAARLHARMWAGELPLEQLRVAAALGHTAAASALGLVPREPAAPADPVLHGLAAIHCAFLAGGPEATRVGVQAARIVAGMSMNAPGIGARPIPEGDGKAWLEAAAERVGWERVVPKVRKALLGWALEGVS